MTDNLFCVWAYRMGDKRSYNFPVGLFRTLQDAKDAADSHHLYRGGKYGHLIYELPVGQEFDAEECKPVMDLLK
jgi:hypothetical protein